MTLQNTSQIKLFLGFYTQEQGIFILDHYRDILGHQTLFRFQNVFDLSAIAQKIASIYPFEKFSIENRLDDEKASFFQKALENAQINAQTQINDASDFWVAILQNARINLQNALDGSQLKGSLKDIPAIIVGAGHSLQEVQKTIKTMKNKALIFTGGKALDLLDFAPDVAFGIDRVHQEDLYQNLTFKDVPIFFQARMSHKNLSCFQGPKIVFAENVCPLMNYMSNQDPFESGPTVVNFMIAVATFLGCNPIWLAGVDLCYKDNKKYAIDEEYTNNQLVTFEGKTTQTDWILAANWIKTWAYLHPETRFINTSKQGLDLKIEQKDLKIDTNPINFDIKKKLNTLTKIAFVDRSEENLRQTLLNIQNQAPNLENDPIYKHLLEPIWNIWGPLFEKEKIPLEFHKFNKMLFFSRILQAHLREFEND